MGPPEAQVVFRPSPNFGERRGGARLDLIVLHYTAMRGAHAALDRLCDRGAEVSAHYLVGETGRIWQMVEEDKRAWHGGAGQWGAVTDVNSRSVGIELANTGAHPFAEPQMHALEGLLQGVMGRWCIPPERVIAHSDMAPGRKFDPGPRFDWSRLARRGLSIWPRGTGGAGDTARFHELSVAFGYADGADAIAVLTAFRARFRPWGAGPVAPEDIAILSDLAARFPVDRGATSA